MTWKCPKCLNKNGKNKKWCRTCNYINEWECECQYIYNSDTTICDYCEMTIIDYTKKYKLDVLQLSEVMKENDQLKSHIEKLECKLQLSDLVNENKQLKTRISELEKQQPIIVQQCRELWALQKKIGQLTIKLNEVKEENICSVCLENPKNAIALNCKHMFACYDCIQKLTDCPICRAEIYTYIKIYPV